MVEMIQRIFHSFEHNNLGTLYPPPEGTGFAARVIKNFALCSIFKHRAKF